MQGLVLKGEEFSFLGRFANVRSTRFVPDLDADLPGNSSAFVCRWGLWTGVIVVCLLGGCVCRRIVASDLVATLFFCFCFPQSARMGNVFWTGRCWRRLCKAIFAAGHGGLYEHVSHVQVFFF